MAYEPEIGFSFPSISPTSHPLVAQYTITLVKGVQVTVQFGVTTAYGLSTGLSSPPPFSRGAIFKVDETAMTAQLAWQYPLNQYSYWGGNVMALVNGDVEICASEPVPIGTTPPETDVPSHVVELKSVSGNPVIVWQMTMKPGGTYRSYRIGSLYPGVIWPR